MIYLLSGVTVVKVLFDESQFTRLPYFSWPPGSCFVNVKSIPTFWNVEKTVKSDVHRPKNVS